MKGKPDWPVVRLSEVAEQCLGKMLDAKKNKGKLMPYLRNPNVCWFEVDTSDLQLMPFEEHELDRFGLLPGSFRRRFTAFAPVPGCLTAISSTV
jgi:hypothetical protein